MENHEYIQLDTFDDCASLKPIDSVYSKASDLELSDTQSQGLLSHRSATSSNQGYSSKRSQVRELVSDYAAAHSPFTSTGRKQLYRTVRSSGPAYQRQIELDEDQDQQPSSFSGWRVGVLLSVVVFGSCLIVEFVMLMVAVRLAKQGQNILFSGSCDKTRYILTVLAIPLNVIATLMTAASNYVMQCVSSPSRSELDRAHYHGMSLGIGVSTPSNAFYMRWHKSLSWWILGVTSIPIHLLLNSAFFATMQANNYGVMVVTQDYEDSTKWQNCNQTVKQTFGSALDGYDWAEPMCTVYQQLTQSNVTSYQRLDNADCIRAYSEALISSHSNVIAIAQSNWTGSADQTIRQSFPALLGYFSIFDYANGSFDQPSWKSMSFNDWLCAADENGACKADEVLKDVNAGRQWQITPEDIAIDHCYSNSFLEQEQCEVGYSLIILLIVIGCDALKLFISLCALFVITEAPCTTIGDAMSSYLTRPDRMTRRMCLVTQKQIQSSERDPVVGLCCEDTFVPDRDPKFFRPKPQVWRREKNGKKWFQAASTGRWLVFGVLASSLVIGCLIIFGNGLRKVRAVDRNGWWQRGLTKMDMNSLFTSSMFANALDQTDGASVRGFLLAVLTVNAPQLAFSFFYFLYNGLFTAMHAAHEWSGYATNRKTLRVSFPSRGQRSTYWLSLPWAYSIPFITISALWHWLVSRSLYMVRFKVFGIDGQRDSKYDTSAVGYSALAIMIVFLLIFVMLAVLAGFSLRKLDSDAPLVGTCSVAISASCHSISDHPADDAHKPLLWGVVREQGEDGSPGHCTFSSCDVNRPIEGHVYE